MKKTLLYSILVLLAVLAFVPACSSDDDDETSSSTSTEQDDDSGDTGDTDDSGDTGDTDDSGDSGDTGDTGDTDDSGDTGDTTTTVTFSLEANVDRSAPTYYKEITYDSSWTRTETTLSSTSADSYTPADGYGLRIIMDVYSGTLSTAQSSGSSYSDFLQRQTLTVSGDATSPQGSVDLTLDSGNYYVLAWADYAPTGSTDSWHYYTDTLSAVRTDLSTYPSVMDLRDCSYGSEGIVIADGSAALESDTGTAVTSVPVSLSRPVGRYKIITDDVQDYLTAGGSLDGITVSVTYSQYVSKGFNVSTGKANSFVESYSFTRSMEGTATSSSTEVLLVGDYILTSSDSSEETVIASLVFYDASGNTINSCDSISIPLMRDGETVIRGPFLTRSLEGGSSFDLDDEFGGEYNVEI